MQFRLLLLLLFCWCITLNSTAQNYWQQQADFTISVTLNDVKHTLDGNEIIRYTNHSPDTLKFIWFHLWPNAFKNDRTAFSEQMVERLDNTTFYFSNAQDKGYINKLAFKVNGEPANLEDHPQYIDIAKLLLPTPLPPGGNIQIATPFHVQLPKNFSRGGHIDQSYQITQWYPKPAVYDASGWHPMPYLDQGEFYNEFGNYDVTIILPKNYVVASTGQLQDEAEKAWLLTRENPVVLKPVTPVKKDIFKKNPISSDKLTPPSDSQTKTLHYQAEQVIDFTWFADKRFIVKHDTVSIGGRSGIDAYNFVLPDRKELWQKSMQFTKRALQFYSAQLGAYPYPSVNVVCAPPVTASGGMEYPMITLVNVGGKNEKELDLTIAHEIGHNWLQAILASNERDHPWMDEGMNTFYERKYSKAYYQPENNNRKDSKGRSFVTDPGEVLLRYTTDTKTDQPVETSSEAFTKINYAAIAYIKAGLWMELMEKQIGDAKMQTLMQAYFSKWNMKHPQPADFEKVADSIAGPQVDTFFKLLHTKGPLPDKIEKEDTKFFILYPTLNNTQKSITISPAIGFNAYDKAQVGVFIHDYGVPVTPLRFAVAPLYATGSKQFNFLGNIAYDFRTEKKISRITPSVTVARFSTDDGEGEDGGKLFRGFFKIVPGLKFTFKKPFPNSNITKWVQWKSHFISEGSFEYKQRQFPQDTFSYYATKGKSISRSVHQLSFGIENHRSLYPYQAVAQLQQVGDILRATVTANYFFNYSTTQGVNIRLFAGKIFYTTQATDKIRNDNYRYHFTMYGPNGEEDYTYSNAFLERNQNTNMAGRQIMIRDGGFKYRSDYSSVRPGRTDNWLAALNFNFDVPNQINPLQVLPFDVPLKVFADVGTYAEAWEENNQGNRFLYSIGLQLPVLKFINVYAVILQSKAFEEPNQVNGNKWWQKRLTFSFDIQHAKPVLGGLDLW